MTWSDDTIGQSWCYLFLQHKPMMNNTVVLLVEFEKWFISKPVIFFHWVQPKQKLSTLHPVFVSIYYELQLYFRLLSIKSKVSFSKFKNKNSMSFMHKFSQLVQYRYNTCTIQIILNKNLLGGDTSTTNFIKLKTLW